MRARWQEAALLIAVLLLPLAIHHGAWRGYFEDDDLDTLTWARLVPLQDFIRDIPSIRYPPEHIRPTGFFYYGALVRTVGLNYPPYAAALQALGMLNVMLLWLLLRRIGLDPRAAAAGCLFFVLPRALFDAWWKPMFIYDVLCTTFVLASILAYVARRWILSFVAFWLAMRTKEVGIVVPAVLLCYEMTLGARHWKRTIPFFVPAAVYGAFGLAFNLRQHSAYSFRFSAPELWKSLSFYSTHLLGIRYAGLAFLVLPAATRDRRVWFGIGGLALGVAIYLLLPGKMLEVYLYLAMTGAAVAIAAMAARRPAIVLAMVLVWGGWQYLRIRKNAAATLAAADERRAFVAALRPLPAAPIYVYDSLPASMHSWGVEGALHLYHGNSAQVYWLEAPGLPAEGSMQLLHWDARDRRLESNAFAPGAATYISAERPAASWQLLRDMSFSGHAAARVYRPAGANRFEWSACASDAELRTWIRDQEVPALVLRGCAEGRAELPAEPAGVVTVEFLGAPATSEIRITRLGFATQ